MPLSNQQTRDIESVLHPYTPLHKLRDTGTLVMESGKGVFVYDSEGNEYIEGMSGLWCAGLGFGDDELVDAATEQLKKLPYYHIFSGKSIEPAIALAEKLKEIAPTQIARTFFASSGSEANDTQIKLAWYYNNARGMPNKKKIISRNKAYHGVTIVSASLTGLPVNHREFDLPVGGILHTDCPHHYRFAEDGESEAEFVVRLANNLREMIEREDPDTIAAMIAEPVMGAGGVLVPPQSYFPAIQPILDEYDILLIDDEVICGFGRTGNWFGAQSLGMKPDTVTLAKQMTAAYAPLSAVMVPQFMMDAFEQQSAKVGTFGHGFTYGGHPLSCALGVKAIEIYQKRNIVGKVRELEPVFAARMKKISDHPMVGEARSLGLVGGVELVADKATKRPFDPSQAIGLTCGKFAEDRGLITRAIGDTMALCPPMIISESELNEMFDRLDKALDDTEAHVAKNSLRAA